MGFNSVFKGLIPVHRPGDDPCWEYDTCACARFCCKWRIVTAYSENILTVHSRYTKYLIFFQSMVVVECSVAPTSSIPLIPTIECNPPHRVRHNPLSSPHAGIISCFVVCTDFFF